MLGSKLVRGADSSFDGVPVGYCPDYVHMEEEVQIKVQVEEEDTGEKHGQEQSEEQREQMIKSHTWVTMQMT